MAKKQTNPFPKRLDSYTDLIRMNFRTRLQSEFAMTALSQQNTVARSDELARAEVSAACDQAVANFKRWLADEYEETSIKMNTAESEFDKSEELGEVLAALSSEVIQRKSRVLKKEHLFLELKRYRNALLAFFPDMENEPTLTPQHLLSLLHQQQRSCLQYLIYRENQLNHLERLEEDLQVIRKLSDSLKFSLQSEILELEERTLKDEERVETLKRHGMELVRYVERTLVLDRKVIALFVDVEDAYRSCVADAVEEASLVEMVRAVGAVVQGTFKEKQVCKYPLNLQKIDISNCIPLSGIVIEVGRIPTKLLYAAEAQCRQAERAALQEAAEASAALRRLEQLERAFRSRQIALRRPRWRSQPPREFSSHRKGEEPLSSVQKEFLHLFTECIPPQSQDEFFLMFPEWDEDEYLQLY